MENGRRLVAYKNLFQFLLLLFPLIRLNREMALLLKIKLCACNTVGVD